MPPMRQCQKKSNKNKSKLREISPISFIFYQ